MTHLIVAYRDRDGSDVVTERRPYADPAEAVADLRIMSDPAARHTVRGRPAVLWLERPDAQGVFRYWSPSDLQSSILDDDGTIRPI